MGIDPPPGHFKLFGAFLPIQPRARSMLNSAVTAGKKPPFDPSVDDQVSRKWALPHRYRDFLLTMDPAVDDQSLAHVYTRTLYPSDVDKGLDRLPIPPKQILEPFLTREEEDFIRHKEPDNKTPYELKVKVIDPSLVVRTMSLTQWNWLDHKEEKTVRKQRSWWYALDNNWMEVVDSNALAEGTSVQVWSFRVNGQLGFIIHKV